MRRPSPAFVIAMVALFVSLGGIGVAANGGSLILGQANSATNATSLTAPVAGGKGLQVTNTNATSGSTALGLNVAPGKAPFTVNSSTKVTNLNADTLDGIDSTGLIQGKGKAYTQAVAIPRHTDGSDNTFTLSPVVLSGFVNFGFVCPPTNTSTPEVDVQNLSAGAVNLFARNDHFTNAAWQVMPSGSTIQFGADTADITTLTVQGFSTGSSAQTVTVATISSVVRTSDCHFQIQAFTTNQ